MKILLLALICASALILGSCSHADKYVRMEGMIWNTVYHITFEGPESLQDSILPTLEKVSKSLSIFDKNSIVSLLNESDSARVDKHFITVYDTSVEINKKSHGNFDPTVSPLITAWGFGIGHTATADTTAVDSVLQFVGIDKTARRGDVIVKEDRRTQFNFSAIAKGYGCDQVGEMLRRNGVVNYMVEIGGEIALSGKSPSGSDWSISIDAPLEDAERNYESAMVISLTDAGVATSGNYRNFRMENGKKYAHTISPSTGRPFFSEILSATVVAGSCMEADALATACMASPVDDAKKILLDNNVEGMLIFADSIWSTPGFKKLVEE